MISHDEHLRALVWYGYGIEDCRAANCEGVERWRPCPGYECCFEVSDFGHVRRRAHATGARAGRVLKGSIGTTGYPVVGLRHHHRRCATVSVHRLVALAFLGIPPPGIEVNHKDGNKLNSHVTNLEYVTRGGNQLHSYQIGIMKPTRGERSGKAKLTESQARMIRDLRGKVSQGALARRFGVCWTTVHDIQNGRRWAHLAGETSP